MALRRTSVQLPTIETQSSPEGKGKLGEKGLNEIETMHMANKSQLLSGSSSHSNESCQLQSSMLLWSLHSFQNVLKNQLL